MKQTIFIYIKKIYKKAKTCYYAIKNFRKPKVFCLSMQRNGTTSVGMFLKDHGYRVAGYGKHSKLWTELWVKGDYSRIFKSFFFNSFQAYEDNPWWMPDFYRVLNCRFPNAKFILFYRDSNKWFDSMLRHPEIKFLVNNYNHNKVYRKLDLYYSKIDNDPSFTPNVFNVNNTIPFESMREHYIKVYEEYNRDVVEYFKAYAPNKLFVGKLEDEAKWSKLGDFLNLRIKDNYFIHIKSPE